MLAILSDLHLCDGTATKENIVPKAFRLGLGEIYEQAAWLAQKQGKADLDLIMLGDVFDLLRTERWLEDASGAAVPVAERPWGSAAALDGAPPSSAVLARAQKILEEIIERNAEALAILRGETLPPPPGVRVRRILLTGNHDRLALHDEALHARMREAVGAADERTLSAEGIHPHRLEMPAYGLVARHGHEWDPWNFESFRPDAGAASYPDEAYLPAPIGDPITTELAARLPHAIRQRLAPSRDLSDEEKLTIIHRLQHIEDVRPLFSALPWIFHEAAHLHAAYGSAKARVVHAALEDSLRAIVADFRALDFFQAWRERRHRLLHLDGPERLAALFDALSVATVDTLARIGSIFAHLPGDGDPCRAGASREIRVGSRGYRFVVYGHTHRATQAGLSATPETQDLYLNSGTFRRRVFLTDDKQAFISSECLSYLCFLREDEAATWRGPSETHHGPSYVAWTGSRCR